MTARDASVNGPLASAVSRQASPGPSPPPSTSPPPSPTTKERQHHDHSQTLREKASKPRSIWRQLYQIITWTPPRCRWDPQQPPQFSMGLNVLFAFAGGFTVANLYYNHPILNILADDFDVPYERVAQIPTVMQAGYAAGLIFLCPLGDLFRRRAFTLILIFFTASMWIGLCLTNNLAVFTAISFITAVTTVTPQLMLPLVGDLAPPNRRAAALSIVTSGCMLGILIARVLSGTMTNFVSWRAVYWLGLGLQYLIFALLWLFMPDYPSANPAGLNYFRMLFSILQLTGRHPVLVQSCLISFCSAATFTGFWTTLTFLLAGPPYHYAPLTIGLFGLIGIAAMLLAPLYARRVTDRFAPLFSVLLGELVSLLGAALGTALGPRTVAGPICQALLNDFGLQTAQIANRAAVYAAADPRARNRVNTAFMVATFCGQLTGTAAGAHVYAAAGWRRSGALGCAFLTLAFVVCLLRGPWEPGWLGWSGGWDMRIREKAPRDAGPEAAADAHPASMHPPSDAAIEMEKGEWKGEAGGGMTTAAAVAADVPASERDVREPAVDDRSDDPGGKRENCSLVMQKPLTSAAGSPPQPENDSMSDVEVADGDAGSVKETLGDAAEKSE